MADSGDNVMKKLCLIIIIILTACTSQATDEIAKVSEPKLTNFEENILDIVGDHSFIYDIQLTSEDIQEITCFVDYYEHSEWKERVAEFTSYISDEKKNDTMRVVFFQQTHDLKEKWTVAVIEDEGMSSIETENERPAERNNMMSSLWGGVSMPISLSKDEKHVIAHLIYSDEDTISIPAFIETDADLNKLTDHEHVYVLSLELK